MKKSLLTLTVLLMAILGVYAQKSDNLVTNGDFETGEISPWGGFKNDVVTTTPYAGTYCGRAQSNDASLKQDITVESGATYKVSFYGKWAAATDFTFKFVVKEGSTKTFEQEITANETDWTLNEATFTTSATTISLVWYKGKVDPSFPAFFLDNVSCVKQTTTGISGVANNEISIFPNPSSGNFQVNSPDELVSYSVFDYTGRIVKEAACSDKKININLSDSPKGVYMIKLYKQNGEHKVHKVVVK